jgi:hypothetical protein
MVGRNAELIRRASGMKGNIVERQANRDEPLRQQSTADLLQILISRVSAFEGTLDLGLRDGDEKKEIVFIDDLTTDMTADPRGGPTSSADPVALVARYAAILKTALEVLEEIRLLQGEMKHGDATRADRAAGL